MVTNAKNHHNDGQSFSHGRHRQPRNLFDYSTTDPHDFTPSPLQVSDFKTGHIKPSIMLYTNF